MGIASLLLLPLPSYAGHWVISLSGNTSVPGSTGVGNYTFANSQVTGPGPWSATYSPYFNVSGGSCSLGLPGSLSVTAKLTWTPDSPTDTSQPPPTVDVLETASAGGAEWMLQPTGVSTSASDGFGDPMTYATAQDVYGASSNGKHLYHTTVSSGQTSVTLPTRSLSAFLSYKTAVTTSGISERMGYIAQIDTREVAITRSGARSPGKVYSPDGQLHGEYVDASGVGHGETTYSTNLAPNWQILHAIFVGAWLQKTGYDDLGQPSGTVPDVTWAWSPKESEDTWYMGKCEMPNSSITYNSDGTLSGKSAGSVVYPVGYAAMDNGDKATAAASYALAVHDQWDNLRLDPSHPFDVIDNDVLVTVGGHEITQENDSASTPAPVGPLSVSCTATATLGFSPTGSFKIGNLLTLGVTFQASVAVAGTVGEQITGAPIPPKNYIQLYFHTHYHRNHYLVDHYTVSGYDQTYTEIVDATPDIAELHWGHSNPLPF